MSKTKAGKKTGTRAKVAAQLTTGSGAPDIVIRTLENAIGAQVREYRKQAGLTVSELASVADISTGMLSKIENGNISHSVNFPATRMTRAGQSRICVANRNVPNMIGQLSHALGASGLNIAQMHNASRGEFAYNLVDVENEVPSQVVGEIAAIPGILSVRVI